MRKRLGAMRFLIVWALLNVMCGSGRICFVRKGSACSICQCFFSIFLRVVWLVLNVVMKDVLYFLVVSGSLGLVIGGFVSDGRQSSWVYFCACRSAALTTPHGYPLLRNLFSITWLCSLKSSSFVQFRRIRLNWLNGMLFFHFLWCVLL